MNAPAPVFSEQRVSMVTLGVADLAVARAFYVEKIGWTPADETETVVFFDLGGIVLGLFGHDMLAADMGGAAEAFGRGAFTLAYNAHSAHEVDAIFSRLDAHRVMIVKPPEKVFWGGYSGYFCDPDGHHWEVAYNPFWPLDAQGRPQVAPAKRISS